MIQMGWQTWDCGSGFVVLAVVEWVPTPGKMRTQAALLKGANTTGTIGYKVPAFQCILVTSSLRFNASWSMCNAAYEALALIDDTLPPPPVPASRPQQQQGQGGDGVGVGGWLYEGLPVPPLLLGPGTPREPFLFLEDGVESKF